MIYNDNEVGPDPGRCLEITNALQIVQSNTKGRYKNIQCDIFRRPHWHVRTDVISKVIQYKITPAFSRDAVVPGGTGTDVTSNFVMQSCISLTRCSSKFNVEMVKVRVKVLIDETSFPVLRDETSKYFRVDLPNTRKCAESRKTCVVPEWTAESKRYFEEFRNIQETTIECSVVEWAVDFHVVA